MEERKFQERFQNKHLMHVRVFSQQKQYDNSDPKKKIAESIVSLIQLNIEKYTIALVATIMCKHAPLTAWKSQNAPLLSHILYLFQYQLQLQVSFFTT